MLTEIGSRGPNQLSGPPSTASVPSGEVKERLKPSEFSARTFDSIHSLLSANMTSLGLPALLRFEDRNSMAHSIEARVPFLDHGLVEFVFGLPAHHKLDGVRTKAILRDSLRGVLPERIRTRSDKIGFRAEPSVSWRLAERHARTLISNRTEYERRWLDASALGSLLCGSDRSTAAEFQLCRIVNFKLWLRTFWGDGDEILA